MNQVIVKQTATSNINKNELPMSIKEAKSAIDNGQKQGILSSGIKFLLRKANTIVLF